MMISNNSPFEDNLISDLPDHILVSILSLLSLKEAAKTSILSRRWVKLWTYTRSLDFYVFFHYPFLGGEPIEVQRRRFINWVNNTLKFHQGTTLDEFTVICDFDGQSCKLDIDSLIIFALQKRPEFLYLDFSSRVHFIRSMSSSGYTLTIQLLSHFTITSLKALILISLDVSGEVVEYILSACPLLEHLKVKTSKSLVRLQVTGPSLNLNTLEIIGCPLEYIEISATNLVSFSYDGSIPKGSINNVPNLVVASIAGECAHFLVENNHQFSGFLSQLETLSLNFKSERFKRFPDFPNMKNLKHLELLLDGYIVESLPFCAELLGAASLLQRLTLMVSWTLYSSWRSRRAGYDVYRDPKDRDRSVKEQNHCKEPVHQHLKVIEFIGFNGDAIEVELLRCLLGRAVSLKRLIISPCSDSNFGIRTECEEIITVAKQLKTRLPPGAELVICNM